MVTKSVENELNEQREALKQTDKQLDLKIQSLELWMSVNLGNTPVHFELPTKDGKRLTVAFERYRRRYHLILIEKYIWNQKERIKKYPVIDLHSEDKVAVLTEFLPNLLRQAVETMEQKLKERESLIDRIESFFDEVQVSPEDSLRSEARQERPAESSVIEL